MTEKELFYSVHPHLLKIKFVYSLASLMYDESSIKFGCGVYFEASSFSGIKTVRVKFSTVHVSELDPK